MRTFGTDVVFERCNVHVRSGGGLTAAGVNGLGNLIIGYNDIVSFTENRTGSHNLVIGPGHTYSSYGGLVAGHSNAVRGPNASVSGGAGNTASGDGASVSGGAFNTASGSEASVSGGNRRSATGQDDWVAGSLFEDN